jgi:hypothetical protein
LAPDVRTTRPSFFGKVHDGVVTGNRKLSFATFFSLKITLIRIFTYQLVNILSGVSVGPQKSRELFGDSAFASPFSFLALKTVQKHFARRFQFQFCSHDCSIYQQFASLSSATPASVTDGNGNAVAGYTGDLSSGLVFGYTPPRSELGDNVWLVSFSVVVSNTAISGISGDLVGSVSFYSVSPGGDNLVQVQPTSTISLRLATATPLSFLLSTVRLGHHPTFSFLLFSWLLLSTRINH